MSDAAARRGAASRLATDGRFRKKGKRIRALATTFTFIRFILLRRVAHARLAATAAV
jgi:hypothetical protein